MTKIGFLASGRGSNFQAIVDAIEAGRIKAVPALLIVDNPDAYAIKRAETHGMEYLCMVPGDFATKDKYYIEIAQELKKRDVSLVVLAGFMRVVRKPLLDAFPMAVINIHPALLPSFPGLHGQRQAWEYGVKVSGCTVHFVDEGVDTGPIIIQAAVPVMDDDTEDVLSARILRQEHRIFPEAVRLICDGRVRVEGRKVMVKGSRYHDEGASIINPVPENADE